MSIAIKKLSLAELKEKANNISQNEMMEKIQGGTWSDCHGFWGGLHKAIIMTWESGGMTGGPQLCAPQGGKSGPDLSQLNSLEICAQSIGIDIPSDAYSDRNVYLALNPAT